MSWKNHGTVNNQNLGSISTNVPWEPISGIEKRFGQLNPPQNGFLTYHGSACASLATTSAPFGTYIAMENAICLDRDLQNKPVIKVYKYIVNNKMDLLQPPKKLYKDQHYLQPDDTMIKELPLEYQKKIKKHLR